MTKDEYLKFHKECCDELQSITKAKNADYTGNSNDPFANFTKVEMLGICSTEQGMMTRIMDKISRITSFMQNGELMVKDESVEDSLKDCANYCLLMLGYIKSKKERL